MDAVEEPPSGHGPQEFADALRDAVRRRGVSLRSLQQRLRHRGHEVSVATLSLWQSGARRPGTDASADVVRELEELLGLKEAALAGLLTRRRRVPEDRNVPFASFVGLGHNEVTDEGASRELSERSAMMISYIDASGQLTRNVLRNAWQARIDGAQEVAAFTTIEPAEVAAPVLRGLIGCELVDIVVDWQQRLVRPTVRLHSPLQRGEIAMTEWETTDHRYEPGATSTVQGLVAVRPEVEVGVFIYFDPEFLPRRCVVTVQEDGPERSFTVPLVGNSASHVEFDFGPGSIVLEWEW
ncbi:hypothetical protein [Microbacterium sp. GCS4]|uniref:hypothetical protein n=1 Tax=Microbacterium sp. GCS4 TaxID=1692239 RepID=UPI00067FEC63|nr:hypothetical protein [Microbacterium sp. GCS4]